MKPRTLASLSLRILTLCLLTGFLPQTVSAADSARYLITDDETARVNAQIAAVDDYIAKYPSAPEVPVLHSGMGAFFRSTGHFSRALEHWNLAFTLAKDRQDDRGRDAADRALASQARLLASLGRLEDLLILIEANKDRRMINPDAGATWLKTLDATVHMKRSPGSAYKCGVYALANVAQQLTGRAFKTIAALGSPETGFSLSSLEEFARKEGIPVRAAARIMGEEIPVPSVVHWSQNHYAAILNRQGDYYTVVDPTFGAAQYLSAEAINEESSGYFLVPQDQLLPAFRWVDTAESSQVFGKGFPDVASDDDPDHCTSECCINSGSGADCTGGDCGDSNGDISDLETKGPRPPSGGDTFVGMAGWSVVEPALNLRISDIPMSYKPAYGPSVVMRVNWQQRAVPGWLGVLGRNSNLGVGAGSSQINFICGAVLNFIPTVAKSGLAQVDLALWTLGNQRIPLSFATSATDSTRELNTGIWARRLQDGSGNIVAIEVYYRNGSMERYEPDPTFAIMNLKIRKDSNGNALTYSYSQLSVKIDDATVSVNRLSTLTTADGKEFSFQYGYSSDTTRKMVITGVSGPDGRSISFGYTFVSGYPYLTSITDVVGITSTLSGNTTYPFWVTQLTTPYGDTQFSYYSQSGCYPFGNNLSCDGIDRSVVITEPDGGHQVYLFYDDVLDASKGIPTAFAADQIPVYVQNTPPTPNDDPPIQTLDTVRNKRNTHHWNRQQAAALSASPIDPLNFSPNDFRISTTKHWLIHWVDFNLSGTMAPVMSWVLPPSADGTTESFPLFYDYEGKDPSHVDSHNVGVNAYEGTQSFPGVISQRKSDGTTWYQYTPRNSGGMQLSRKERWERTECPHKR